MIRENEKIPWMDSRAHFLAGMMFLARMHSRYRPLLYARMRMTSLSGCSRSFPRENVSSRQNVFSLLTAMVGENYTRVIAVSSKNLAGECARTGVTWQCAIHGELHQYWLASIHCRNKSTLIGSYIYVYIYTCMYIYIYIYYIDASQHWYLIIEIQSLIFNRFDHWDSIVCDDWDLIIDIECFGHLITNGDLPEYIVESPPVRKHARQMPTPDRS